MRASVGSVLRLLPRLRRYATAVAGSLRAGDQYVEMCLETLIQEPGRFDLERPILPQLFELLHDAIDACGIEETLPADLEFDGSLGRAVARLSPTERRLLLLVALEGLSLGLAARILALSKGEARRRLASAYGALRDIRVARILVIEDNKPLADDLADLINESGHMLVGIAADTRRAAVLAQRRRPDLIVVDLHRGMGGLGPVRAMLKGERLPVVFLGGRPAALRQDDEPIFVIDDRRDMRLVEDTINRALIGRNDRDDDFREAVGT